MSQATRILLALIAGLIGGILIARAAPGIAGGGDRGDRADRFGLAARVADDDRPAGRGAARHRHRRIGRGRARGRGGAGAAILTFVVILWLVTLIAAVVMPLLLDLWPLPGEWAQALRQAAGRGGAGGRGAGRSPPSSTMIVPTNIVAAAAADAYPAAHRVHDDLRLRGDAPAGGAARVLVGLFQAIADAMIVIIGWVLLLAPIGIFAWPSASARAPAPPPSGRWPIIS